MRETALVLLILTAPACGARSGSTAGARADRNLITQEQILQSRSNNAYEVVQALHGNWLQARGADSFARPTVVIVYVDDTRMGGVETLRTITTASISYIRYYDGLAATGRWGMDHGQGVIYVSTRPQEQGPRAERPDQPRR
jgi:hypothetical protein